MADQNPDPNNRDRENDRIGSPYQPEDLPIPDLSEEEEDPSEDESGSDEEYLPQNAQMDEDSEEYHPYGDFGPDEEVVPEGAQAESRGSQNVGEISTPPPPPPQMPRYPSSNRISRTSPMNNPPTNREDLYSFVPLAIAAQQRRNADIPAHYEIGESSQAPRPDPAAPQDNGLVARVQRLEELLRALGSTSRTFEPRIERLEEEERSDTEAIQLLYHRMGASRSEATTISAQIRALEYRAQISESRLDAAEFHIRIVEQRADAVEQWADAVEQRADAAEQRADAAEQRADAAEQQAYVAEQERRQLQERYDELVRLRGNQFGK